MTLLLEHDDMAALLDPGSAVEALRGALREQAAGQVAMPPRQTTDAADGQNWLRISSAFLNGSGYMGFKSMNRAAGLGMRYMVALYAIGSGELLALMDANLLTTARTAATSALGTDLLAPSGADRVGVIGAGVQAGALVRALARLRRLDAVTVYSPREASRTAFARQLSEELGVPATAVESPEKVARACELTVLALRAPRTPVYRAAWLRPGVHVTGLSSVRPEAREVEDGVWAASQVVVVDDRGTVGQSGDGRSAAAAGVADPAALPELWELVAGRVGRGDDQQVTMFKSAGNAMQDVALAAEVYRRAVDAGRGRDLGAFPAVKPYL